MDFLCIALPVFVITGVLTIEKTNKGEQTC